MFEVIGESSHRYLYCGLFVLAALSLLPWTYVLAEMLGPAALIGLGLMAVLLLGGYGYWRQWRALRGLSVIASALTTALFAIMTAGLMREDAGPPSSDLSLIFGLPLLLNSICFVVALLHFGMQFYEGDD